jgi:hypothetical protein
MFATITTIIVANHTTITDIILLFESIIQRDKR